MNTVSFIGLNVSKYFRFVGCIKLLNSHHIFYLIQIFSLQLFATFAVFMFNVCLCAGEVDYKEIGDCVHVSGHSSTDLCVPALDYLHKCSQVGSLPLFFVFFFVCLSVFIFFNKFRYFIISAAGKDLQDAIKASVPGGSTGQPADEVTGALNQQRGRDRLCPPGV